MKIVIREATPADAPACGKICYDAFLKIANDHNFPPDLPSSEAGIGLMGMMFAHPGFYSIVAELDGRLVGSNNLDERSLIPGVGPITVDPAVQNSKIGRDLMQAVMDRAESRNAPGIRLVQAAYHNRSLSLYAKLGFDPREPLSVMQGPPMGITIDGYAVRKAAESDLEACNRVCRAVHGHDRGGELKDSIGMGSAVVVERHGKITGYSSAMAYFGHSVGETNLDLEAMIGAAPSFDGPGILVPMRNAELFRWCLGHGLRVVAPMTLMTMGLYNEPEGAYLPGILY